jgi:XTP/dITP diphosphohydrolase
MVRFPDGRELWREGVVTGAVAETSRGGGGFGYDPVFVPDEGDGRTFAELRPEEKHAISHRGRALRALADVLRREDPGTWADAGAGP